MLRRFRHWIGAGIASWRPEEGDAVLYAGSALFAGVTAGYSGIDLYRQWAEIAVGFYLAAAVFSAMAAHSLATAEAIAAEVPGGEARAEQGRGSWHVARVWIFAIVLGGATLLPLTLEVAWRSDGNPSAHVQPETTVVEQSAQRAVQGKDPYRAVTNAAGHLVIPVTKGQPVYENFDPYLPAMTVFGIASTTKGPIRLTDARIFFTIATLLVVALALYLHRGRSEPKFRTLQVLTVLPTAALPLATGGDDMPIVALLLLAMVLAQRRRPGWSGIVIGLVSSMKFTAWPMAALALFAARDKDGRRAPSRMLLGMVVVAGPIVAPFIVRGPYAFFENVVLYPLGLSGVASPATSPLPGHLLVSAFPSLHRVLPITVAAIGGSILALHLLRRPPKNAAEASTLTGWVMTVAIFCAPATRIGYLLYPINFFVWGALLRDEDEKSANLEVLQSGLLTDDANVVTYPTAHL